MPYEKTILVLKIKHFRKKKMEKRNYFQKKNKNFILFETIRKHTKTPKHTHTHTHTCIHGESQPTHPRQLLF